MTASHIDEIEKALEGVTKGPWETRQMGKRLTHELDWIFVAGQSDVVHGLDGICEPDRLSDRSFAEDNANMRYIAACSPDRMSAILSQARMAEALERENAEKEEARAEQWRLRRDAEGSRDAARAAADALERENAALREALKPFGKLITADGLEGGFLRSSDAHPLYFHGNSPAFTVGDVRRARALLKEHDDARN